MKQWHLKLVRDGIPGLIVAAGARCQTLRLDPAAMREALARKLQEEAAELAAATTETQFIDEAADVLEVLLALVDERQIEWNRIEQARASKAARVGMFDDRTVLLWSEDNDVGVAPSR